MTEPQQEPTPWHVVWVRVLIRAYDAGMNVEQKERRETERQEQRSSDWPRMKGR
jgi:hypothetical protein